jgi:DNA modification methylase
MEDLKYMEQLSFLEAETASNDLSIINSKSRDESERITGTKAMQLMELSRHNFDKLVKDGVLIQHIDGKKKYYLLAEIKAFMGTDEYKQLAEGTVDKRNTLNDLTGKDWLPETKSFFYQKGLGANHPEAQIEKLHPAPYSFQDIGHLIRFFTKKGMMVLDPFGGVGSTAKACEVDGRICTSIELSPKWHELSIKRLESEVGEGTSKHHNFINGDSCEELKKIETGSIDFVVTSPPYWGILNKLDQKVIKNRVQNNLETKYSENEKDLGNVEDYEEFLDILVNKVFLECARTLRNGKYMTLIVSDFRDKSDYISFHSDLIYRLNKREIPDGGLLKLQGTKILLQNHKSLLPYGYPFAYVENIHHQYVLIFKKEGK